MYFRAKERDPYSPLHPEMEWINNCDEIFLTNIDGDHLTIMQDNAAQHVANVLMRYL